jgi:hypothetical protein
MFEAPSWDEAREELHRGYLGLNDAQLSRAIKNQMLKPGQGVPIREVLRMRDPLQQANFAKDPELLKALTSISGAALIRQDLEAPLYALFVRKFPWLERLRRKPANGITHTAVQMTATGSLTDAQLTVSELGTVNDDASTYQRALFPVAVFAARRGVSLKTQFATIQGGAGFNPETQEIEAGTIALASAVQRALLQGNSTYSSGTGTTEGGAYNVNAIDGLRMVLGQVPGSNYAPAGSQPSNSIIIDDDNAQTYQFATGAAVPVNPITAAIQSAVAQSVDKGGMPTAVVMSATMNFRLDQEQTQFLRFVKPQSVEVIPGVHAPQIETPVGLLPIIMAPGQPMGTYNRTADAKLVDDIYVVDESGLAIVWLGSESLTVLEIPIGVNGQLSALFIPFLMYGLEIANPLFDAKIRVPR